MSAGFLALPCMEAAGSWQQAASKDARLLLLWLMSAKRSEEHTSELQSP